MNNGERKMTLDRKSKGGAGNAEVVPLKLRDFGIGAIGSSIVPRDVQWLWWPLFPMGAISVIASPGNVGKGLVISDIAARITKANTTWPLSDELSPTGNVIWGETEDPRDSVLAPRWIAAGADMDRIVAVNRNDFQNIDREYILRQNIRLIVLSPLQSFIESEADNDDRGVRRALEKLHDLVKGTQCSILGIMHPNKKADLAALERLLGSVAFRNFVRAVALLKSEDGETVRVMHGKWNWSVRGDDMLFTKHNRRADKPRGQYIGIDWEEAEENEDPDSAFDRKKDEDDLGAGEWLEEYLTGKGWVDCQAIFKAAEGASHTMSAIKKAKNRLNRKRKRIKHDHDWDDKRKKRDYWKLLR